MSLGDLLTLKEAASRLGCSEAETRKLIRTGRVVARRVGNQWFVDGTVLRDVVVPIHRAGRPFDQRLAWAILGQIEERETAPALHRQERARLRSYLGQPTDVLWQRMRRRATLRFLSIASSRAASVLADGRFMLGGRRAAAFHLGVGDDGDDGDEISLYVPASAEEDFYDASYAVPDMESPNLYLRLVDDRYWPFGDASDRFVWPSVAFLDCHEDGHPIDRVGALWPGTARPQFDSDASQGLPH